MSDPHQRLEALADRLERAMREAGAWSEPLPPRPAFRQAFGMDAMPFEHWLQGVLVPAMRRIAAERAALPPSSGLAAHAVREFDGRDGMAALIDVLRQIDGLSPAAPPSSVRRGPRTVLFGLGAVAALALVLAVSAWLGQALRGYFPAETQLIHSWDGNLALGGRPRSGLRVVLRSVLDADGAMSGGQGEIHVVWSDASPRPPPLRFRTGTPPAASAILAWLAASGIGPDAASGEAAHQAARLAAIAAAVRSRAELDAAAARPPPGIAPPAVVEWTSKPPDWPGAAIAIALLATLAIPAALWLRRANLRR